MQSIGRRGFEPVAEVERARGLIDGVDEQRPYVRASLTRRAYAASRRAAATHLSLALPRAIDCEPGQQDTGIGYCGMPFITLAVAASRSSRPAVSAW